MIRSPCFTLLPCLMAGGLMLQPPAVHELLWRETRSTVVIIIGILSVAKIAFEVLSGQALFTDITWPPLAMEHLTGIQASPLAVLIWDSDSGGHNIPNNS